ncbi:bifunctional folylpolyglutamate synthase/dihydrofolate synthase [Methylobrevis pamukkalensis]|uniref:Dihydrofolate synthase/folylpolyglutamate synthase n=1 Tax=Methylobrevis pamukkalensis TaxID=1439726 RepID=A0A1E3H4Q5_9HYPH|nr:folylpolyglutamate synthase/dihydrofolate synthase family protein [Methylobrevis pamukkalensis]ODN71309.1 Folylpolyglutamate synthase [Methylobrevis pamukkalensis]
MPATLEIIDRLSSRWPKGYDLSLARIERLLGALGDPHLRIPPVIHVAGTNGKGSTIAFLRAMLEANRARVHTHTSPHLVRFNERYRLATGPGRSSYVGDAAFSDALARVEAANGDEQITLFEMLTAAGFVLFSEHPADYVLLEVGLGGRFDATNVIRDPLVSVITSISLDHQAFLGDTVTAIAGEKAGIIKRGRPVVTSPATDEIRAVFETEAARRKAPLFVGGQDWAVHEEHGRLVYQDGQGLLDLPRPRLAGQHQFQNAGTAIAALRHAGLAVPVAAIEAGLDTVEWPARLQRLMPGPLFAGAVSGTEIWLDGGHNAGAGEVVSAAMADLEERVARPLVLVVGMLTTKDPVGFFSSFKGLARHVYTVPIASSDAGWPPEELAAAATSAGLAAESAPDVADALARLSTSWNEQMAPRILVCGSLYLAGEVLALNDQEPA